MTLAPSEYWRTFFSDFQPSLTRISVEFGPGWGEHIVARAAETPHDLSRKYLAVEFFKDRAYAVAKKIFQQQLPPEQIKILQGRAQDWLRTIPPPTLKDPTGIDVFYSLYPDPWPKRRHAKHRIIGPVLTPLILRRLSAGARWYFATDMKAYAEMTARLLQRLHTLWTSGGPALFSVKTQILERSDSPRTQFEARCFQRGFQCWEVLLTVGSSPLQLAVSETQWKQLDRLFEVEERLTVGQAL